MDTGQPPHEVWCKDINKTIYGVHKCSIDWETAIMYFEQMSFTEDEMDINKEQASQFIEAFEASKARIAADVHSAQHGPTVLELRAGDVLYHPMAGHMLFVCRGAHPIWHSLQAVVWCSPEGKLSVDALDPRQVLAGQLTNRDETPEQRGLRFRQWYLERKA